MFLGLIRDRTAVFFMLVLPLLFLVLFGALFQGEGGSRSTVVQYGEVTVLDELDEEHLAALSEALVLERTGDREDALERLRAGEVDAVVWEETPGTLELRYSAADEARAGAVRGLVNSLVQDANVAATGQPPAFRMSTERVEDESIRAIQFLAPGLLGWAIAMGASFMSAFTLVNWRRKRLLRRLWLAPIRPGAVVGARIGVSLGLAMAQLVLFLAVAVIPFYGLRLTDMWWLSIPLVACGTLAFMAVGLLIGAVTSTEEAANGVLQAVIMPMAFLSGSFFPTEVMPGWLEPIARLLPLKHLNEALMGVLSRGEGWGTALPVMGGLLLFAAVVAAIAARLFRWEAK
ncbi:ABC transporter permease [Streptomyces calidiresistens]|uniref:ABC transporter permease n=2 Tax=Streptomyces calidiresistens TaxID=1485586 RepID=A0A7W3T1W0_9ACTN|nr:ABC transporter permease [Streptomyces calidiresistens]